MFSKLKVMCLFTYMTTLPVVSYAQVYDPYITNNADSSNSTVSDPVQQAEQERLNDEKIAQDNAKRKRKNDVNSMFTDDFGMKRTRQVEMDGRLITLAPEQRDTTGGVNAYGAFVPSPPRRAMDGNATGGALDNDSIGYSSQEFIGRLRSQNRKSNLVKGLYKDARKKEEQDQE